MRPLSQIAAGLVVVALSVVVAGWDVLADPLGWLLVLLGTRRLPGGVPQRTALLVPAALALVVAAATWPPGVAARVLDADPALVWALGLPEIAYAVLLAHALVGAATRAGDAPAARWWATARVLTAVTGLLPVLIFGGGLDALRVPAGVLTGVVPLLVIVLLLVHAGRPWADAPAPSPPRS